MEKKLEILALTKIELEKIIQNCKSWNNLYSIILKKDSNSSLKWFLKKKIKKENIDVSFLFKTLFRNCKRLITK